MFTTMIFSYFSLDEILMLWTIDFLVLQEDTVALAGAHEVVVTGARGEAAGHCGSWLLTLLTVLNTKYNRL